MICDRFTDSTIAYQVFGKGVKLKFINDIHKYILKGLRPNLIFILKVSADSSRKRLSKRKSKNRYDNFPQSFYNKAQKSFLKISKNKKNYYIFYSSKNDDILEKKILAIVLKKLRLK